MTENLNQPKDIIYINRKKPIVTYILIAICTVIFLADQITGKLIYGYFNTGILTYLGVKNNDLISSGEVWRLMTSVFLHLDIRHIGFNMIALYIWGKHAEALYGRKNYLFIYLLAGLLGSLGSYAFSSANGLGASGAIYGILGAIFYVYLYNKQFFLHVFSKQIFILAAISLGYGFILPNIDNMAHLFGLVGGFLAAAIFGVIRQVNKRRLYPALIVYLIIAIGCGVIGYVFN
ncbi:MAG: rhomboid family intramembrane serine protease [Clostridia bacterium]|nr:rhomboid family intramembrane serine protease [Clostridia bacterium]